VTNAVNSKYSSTGSLGELFIGNHFGQQFQGAAGFYSNFLLPPRPPLVIATQGDLLDRIQLTWNVDPLSPSSSEGFNIYRDDIFLANVGNNIRTFNDFNVIAGIPYNYTVRGVNSFGEGFAGNALGFQVPNGVVTGWVRTPSGNSVPNTVITLTPMQGFSAYFGPGDGAVFNRNPGDRLLIPSTGENWSIAFWVKTDMATNDAGIIEIDPVNVEFQPINSSTGKDGIVLQLGGSGEMTLEYPDSTRKEWHHITLTFDGDQYRGYLDGKLVDSKAGFQLDDVSGINIGSEIGHSGIWQGKLDEIRFYSKVIDVLEFDEVRFGTASSLTQNLEYYWKMDEEQGAKSFDLVSRAQLLFCGTTFDADRPPVNTAGVTNEDGYYRIESASYGTGTTFLAKPAKNFYSHRALQFKDYEDHVSLPDFPLPPRATIELWFNPLNLPFYSTLLYKKLSGDAFEIYLRKPDENLELNISFNGVGHNFGSIPNINYQHLAVTIDSMADSRNVSVYINGNNIGNHIFPSSGGNLYDGDGNWFVGNSIGQDFLTPFNGLIDEIAVYDSILTNADINKHVNKSRDPQERGLYVYFPFDEGNGVRLNNLGSYLTGPGSNNGGEWTAFAPNQTTTAHKFSPNTRQVTLNPSITSVDQVDFIDLSTVAVSGFVRYANSGCFAPDVEILVNGESFSPAIFTNAEGKFTIDFDPGASAILTPKLSDHQFVPANWELVNVISPVGGILFNDVTRRKVEGVVAGGMCKKSIIEAPPGEEGGTVVVVKIRSVDGCFQDEIVIDNQLGEYAFENLPPLSSFTIAVTEHSDPKIKSSFEVAGGKTIDLTENDTIVDFLYFAPPEVQLISGLDPLSGDCETIVLDKDEFVSIQLSLVEKYVATESDDGICVLDTADFTIINGISGGSLDTSLSGPILEYKFKTGEPNPTPPYLKTLQVIGKSASGQSGDLVIQAVVTGIRNKENTFTTQLPEVPILVLRDPPGDQSYSYWEKENKACTTFKTFLQTTDGISGELILDYGPDPVIVAAPLGIGVLISTNTTIGTGVNTEITYRKVEENSFEVCMDASERISTSSSENIVGEDADVYVGLGTNIAVGFADQVTFNDTICSAVVKEVISVEPLSATTFMYSQHHIKNNVIRYLTSLIENEDLMPDSVTLKGYKDSRDLWQSFIDDNIDQKNKAEFLRNLSFDAGVSYEYSESSDSTSTVKIEDYVDSNGKARLFAGTSVEGVGFKAELTLTTSKTEGTNLDNSNTKSSIKTGYVLGDNDTGDAFTVDVKMDTVYKTPVFDIVAGQSSCPLEAETANREGPFLAFNEGSKPIAINIPSHESAIFNMTLGNLSATNEDWTYVLSSIDADNPDGAVIKANGAILGTRKFIVPYGETLPITISVQRGPVKYEYDSLRIALYSECEYERNLGLSLPIDRDSLLFSGQYLSVDFIKPCSEVDINVPEKNWVVINNDPIQPGTMRRITVSGYDLNSPDFQLIRVQYRKTAGNGEWINIKDTSDRYNPNWSGIGNLPGTVPILKPGFTQFSWETAGLEDGEYDIHAWAVCSGDATENPGFSEIIKGRIDREPPKLIGVPQPSDGVYHLGDEISFTFDKFINCASYKLIPGDQSMPNNVALYDVSTGKLIDIEVFCFENKLIIEPNFVNKVFENKILRVELHNIEDLTGNVLEFEKWEFYVDRNELGWLSDSIAMTKTTEDIKVVSAPIHNRGGYPVPFEILNAPSWVRVFPNKGTLVPNEIRDIYFEVDSSLAFGRWSDTIILNTLPGQNPFYMGGEEPIPIGVRVVCPPPMWEFDARSFENTMNFALELNIEGDLSKDNEDIVAAFINGRLVGRAYVEYEAEVDKFLAYMSVYGNPDLIGETITFEIWDASTCLRYGEILESFEYQADFVVGRPDNPQVLHTTSLILREVPLGYGWNWVSFNLDFQDSTLNSALNNTIYPDGDIIRGRNAFSQNVGGTWFGPLNAVSDTTMYVYYSAEADTISIFGHVIPPASKNLHLSPGWNWIGYIPNYTLPLNEALGSVPAQPGDLIKSQFSFAQYLDDERGWVGSLGFMKPLNGYQIKLDGAGTIEYPPSIQNRNGVGTRNVNDEVNNYWVVNPLDYEFSMTLIGIIKSGDQNITTPSMELGAFSGDTVVGSARAFYVSSIDAYQFFITMYGNRNDDLITFKVYDTLNQQITLLNEILRFGHNRHFGNIIDEPFAFTINVLPIDLKEFYAEKVECGPVYLNWETASEVSNDFIEIQRSLDGIHFTTIGSVPGINNPEGGLYSYVDHLGAETELIYYRLNQVDFNGESQKFDPILVRNTCVDSNSGLVVYPNPASGKLFIQYEQNQSNEKLSLIINDLFGKEVKYLKGLNFGKYDVEINIDDLAPGIYYLKVDNRRDISPVKFIKIN
jgi:hypothetical protein